MKDRKVISYGDFKKSHAKLDAKKGLDKKKAGIRTPAKKGSKGWDTLEDAGGHVGGKPKDESKTKSPGSSHFGVKPPKKRLSSVKVHEGVVLEAFYVLDGVDHVSTRTYTGAEVNEAKKRLFEEIESNGGESIEVREVEPANRIDEELWRGLEALVSNGCDGKYGISKDKESIEFTLKAFVEEYSVDPGKYDSTDDVEA